MELKTEFFVRNPRNLGIRANKLVDAIAAGLIDIAHQK